MGLVTLLFCQKSNSFSSLICYCLAIPHEIVPLVQLIIDKLLQKNLKVNKRVVLKIKKIKKDHMGSIRTPKHRGQTHVRVMIKMFGATLRNYFQLPDATLQRKRRSSIV